MFGWLKKKALPQLDESMIVPRIKHHNFLAVLRDMKVPDDQMPVTEPLVGDLLVAYAFDLPVGFQMVSVSALNELGIERDEVRRLAANNLKRQFPKIEITADGSLKRIQTGENLEACVFLARAFWADLAAKEAAEIVSAVPSRDVLIFCSSEDRDTIRRMQKLAAKIRMAEGTHGLSELLFAWRRGKWVEYSAK